VIALSVGGILMGLANLVPGISGGTMLLAAGVYPAFIGAIAQLTTLKIRLRPVLLLGVVGGAAAVAILLLAGATKTLVVEQRWVMYSLFIGLTLGGVPLVWRLARPATPAVWAGAAFGFVVMLLMALAPGGGAGGGDRAYGLLLLSGVAGSGAMILPGVSGGYLLLLLGQYVKILGAIDNLKVGLLGGSGGGPDLALVLEAAHVVVPVGCGVVIGVVVISNVLDKALSRFPKPTLGALLGLLVGAVVGLWPFQEGVPPQAGETFKGEVLSAAAASEVDAEDWPLQRFTPSAGQAAGSVGLVAVGLALTLLIDRIGGTRRDGDLPPR
jgi:putative membrane protein